MLACDAKLTTANLIIPRMGTKNTKITKRTTVVRRFETTSVFDEKIAIFNDSYFRFERVHGVTVQQPILQCASQYTVPVFSERELTYLLSPVRLSVVCNVRPPYSGGSNFRQYFYGIRYLGHPTETFTEIVPGNPSSGRGS